MNEEQTSYKVTDRRLFNADGTPRDVPESERPEPKPAKPEAESTAASELPESAANAADADVAEVGVKAEPPAAADEADAMSSEAEMDDVESELPGAEDPASFASFMMSIASNAASSLGMMEHPVTHKREVDLELGKHWIDVLGMLQQKTHGNLSPQEQQILEGLLADLRMQFVSLTNTTPKARSFTSQDITGG